MKPCNVQNRDTLTELAENHQLCNGWRRATRRAVRAVRLIRSDNLQMTL